MAKKFLEDPRNVIVILVVRLARSNRAMVAAPAVGVALMAGS